MRSAFVLLTLLSTIAAANAQTPKEKFISYGLQIDRAKTAAVHGQHQKAMVIYDSAFAQVPFMSYDYFDAVLNALEAGSDDRANALLIQGTENGLAVEELYDTTMHAFLMSERSMPYLNMREFMKSRWLAHADTTMIRKLREMGNANTWVVDSNGAMVKLPDTLAFHRTMALAKESGWPTPLTVGSDFYRTQSLLFNHLDHYPDSPEWQMALPYIRSAMARGALPPNYLAPFQDMADVAAGKPMTYGTLLLFYRNDPAKWLLVDPSTLENNRRSVGLGPLENLLFQFNLDPTLVRYAAP